MQRDITLRPAAEPVEAAAAAEAALTFGSGPDDRSSRFARPRLELTCKCK